MPTAKTAVKKFAADKSAVKKPAVKKPAANKAATKKPAADKPVTSKPVNIKPATKKPAAKQPTAAKAAPRSAKIVVKDSRIHGRGIYATRKIAKGERVIEYKGELIKWKEADRRPPSDPDDPHHTFFFSLSDGKHVIDAAVGGNIARWINHSCEPNCETEEDDAARRVFVHALRDIKRGEELFYDYGLVIDERITPKVKLAYQCRCGSPDCRGTMLALKSRKKKG